MYGVVIAVIAAWTVSYSRLFRRACMMNCMSCRNRNRSSIGGSFSGNSTVSIGSFSSAGQGICRINGIEYKFPGGKDISIQNGVLLVDGQSYQEADAESMLLAEKIEIHIHPDATGIVPDVTASCVPIVVHGNARDVQTSNASVTVDQNVLGDVETSNGKITVNGNISGNATTSNASIHAKAVAKLCHTSNGNIYAT
jgi:hypothetical protein